jgi:hypothetical protein
MEGAAVRKLFVLNSIALFLLMGCASPTPGYDPNAKESLGRIIGKEIGQVRTQARADSFNAGPALVGTLGAVGIAIGDSLEKKTQVPIFRYRIRAEDGREIEVHSEYAMNQVGDCVRLFESERPTYPRFTSADGCR